MLELGKLILFNMIKLNIFSKFNIFIIENFIYGYNVSNILVPPLFLELASLLLISYHLTSYQHRNKPKHCIQYTLHTASNVNWSYIYRCSSTPWNNHGKFIIDNNLREYCLFLSWKPSTIKNSSASGAGSGVPPASCFIAHGLNLTQVLEAATKCSYFMKAVVLSGLEDCFALSFSHLSRIVHKLLWSIETSFDCLKTYFKNL